MTPLEKKVSNYILRKKKYEKPKGTIGIIVSNILGASFGF